MRTLALLLLTIASVNAVWADERDEIGKHTGGLTFSNTQSWVPDFLQTAKDHAAGAEGIEIPQPPALGSVESKAELRQLLDFQKARTVEQTAMIFRERGLSGWILGDFVLDDHLGAATPVGNALTRVLNEVGGSVFVIKKRFDRVRPMYVSSEIKPLFETPGHPSYPSGHASQSYAAALLLAEIDPAQKETLLCDASRIAIGREIAGVHYPSDSAAGQIFARQVFKRWIKKPESVAQVKAARNWWKTNGAAFLKARSYRKIATPRFKPPCTLESVRSELLGAPGR